MALLSTDYNAVFSKLFSKKPNTRQEFHRKLQKENYKHFYFKPKTKKKNQRMKNEKYI